MKSRTAVASAMMFLLFALLARSQKVTQSTAAGAAQRSFHASKADVEKAIRELPSYPGGTLPVLDGFADPAGHWLDGYKQARYAYDVQVKSSAAGATTVWVTAKVTAWYNGTAQSRSGYRLLKSNGRLESDLLDALDDKLNPKAAESVSSAAPKLPDSPSAVSSGSFFNTPRLTTAASGSAAARPPAKPADPATAKRLQTLDQEAESLQQVLNGQSHPNNLAVVKRANTPVVAQAVDGSEVMFQAEAEDEFEVLDSTDSWVHIKISDLSRAWIKREYVDLPGAAMVSVAAVGDQHDQDLVRQTKQEVAAFPGKWNELNGKQVKIIWVQPVDKDQFGSAPKWTLAKNVFREADAGNPAAPTQVAGVVVIFDSQDGGMAASTLADLQQWRAGHLSDEAFWKRCWRDPADAFASQN